MVWSSSALLAGLPVRIALYGMWPRHALADFEFSHCISLLLVGFAIDFFLPASRKPLSVYSSMLEDWYGRIVCRHYFLAELTLHEHVRTGVFTFSLSGQAEVQVRKYVFRAEKALRGPSKALRAL